MKQVAGRLRLDLAQYRELQAFAQFGSDLDKATKAQLNRGARLMELLKQGQYKPLTVEKQVVIIYAGTTGHLDDLPMDQVPAFEQALFEHLDARGGGLLARISQKKSLDAELMEALKTAVAEFKKLFMEQRAAAGRS